MAMAGQDDLFSEVREQRAAHAAVQTRLVALIREHKEELLYAGALRVGWAGGARHGEDGARGRGGGQKGGFDGAPRAPTAVRWSGWACGHCPSRSAGFLRPPLATIIQKRSEALSLIPGLRACVCHLPHFPTIFTLSPPPLQTLCTLSRPVCPAIQQVY
jgi:hypothetical protein